MSHFASNAKSRGLIAGVVSAAMLLWSDSGAQSAAPVPDFSGPWGRNAFDFEPLPSGPVPVVNLKHRANGTGDPAQLVGDYKNPILKPEAADVVKKKGEISIGGEAFPDPSNQCVPYAPPFTYAMQLGLQVLQKKDAITIIYYQDDQVRHVRLSDSHPAHVAPSVLGDSVGHYEGDTLVVDTVGIKVGAVSMVDRYGTPHSEALHVVERYRLIDGAQAKEAQERHEKQYGRLGGRAGIMLIDPDTKLNGLQVQVTVEDPNVFTAPWTANVTFRHRRDTDTWLEIVCAENPVEYYKNQWIGLPTADKLDF